MKDYSNKKVEELSFKEVQDIKDIIYNLPSNMNVYVEDEDLNKISFEEAIEDIHDDFFDVEDSAFEKIVGKCFINEGRNEILKVIGLSTGLSSKRSEYEEAYEFIFERFYLYEQGTKRESWELPDYIWLQETTNYDEKYKPYCLSSLADMNVGSENMYHLGKDGRLYVDRTCGGDYEAYSEVSSHLFEYAKEQATSGGTKTYEIKTNTMSREVNLEKGELLLVSNDFNDIYFLEGFVRKFDYVKDYYIFASLNDRPNDWDYAVPLSKINIEDLEATRKEILEARDGKLIKFCIIE